ncbi:MAG: GNAT family N-acetyltransferase [Microthrixaceae bacterium]
MTILAAALPLPDPPLVDGEILLRPWEPRDAPVLAVAWADPDVARWTGVPARCDEAAASRWISGESDRRARGLAVDLVIEAGGCVVGEVGLAGFDPHARAVEIGWWVAPERRRQGVATRAVRLVTEWALAELHVEAVLARCHPDNPGSGAVARRAGFVPAGSLGADDLWRAASIVS